MSYVNRLFGSTPQTEPQLGRSQVRNNAGGFAYKLDDWGRLQRFLILGSEGGTYYATERKLTRENAAVVERLLLENGERVVDVVASISESGRAHKNDPALLALALAAKTGDPTTRAAAFAALPRVARTGTHLFQFVSLVNELGGWGRGTKRAVGRWYNSMDADKLAYQMVKYQQRDGWSHRDVLRLAHPKPSDAVHDKLYAYAAGKVNGEAATELFSLPEMVVAFERVKSLNSAQEVADLIRKANLPREAVPTQWLTERVVWEALLERAPMTMLLRNLATLTRAGVFDDRSSVKLAEAKLTDEGALRSARVHPMSVLIAAGVYRQGHGERGHSVWTPNERILGVLDDAFYKSFHTITPTGLRWSVNLDHSGSMYSAGISGAPGLTAAAAATAMAMVTVASERGTSVNTFDTQLTDRTATLTPGLRLDQLMAKLHNWHGGGTDCALPMRMAERAGEKYDVFAVYTDNETWAGVEHADEALRRYRRNVNPTAKLVVVGMTATEFTIADPNDAGMLDVVGFDAAAPALMADWVRG